MGVADLMVYWRAFLMRCTLAGLSRVVIRSATSDEVAAIATSLPGARSLAVDGSLRSRGRWSPWWRTGTVRRSEK